MQIVFQPLICVFQIHLYLKGLVQKMEEIKLRTDYIKLGQVLKAMNLVESGADAKAVIEEGLVKVNGETAFQRGKKLYDGDVVSFENEEIKITK